jgi:predicted O-methyltransferase YrrM
MNPETWTSVDEFLSTLLHPHDPPLDEALRSSDAAALPPISVSPPLGMLLHILATGVRARRILEIGTLGGYSSIWLARALPPDGELVTLEYSPKHAAVARQNLARAGLSNRVAILEGPAVDSLAKLADECRSAFDFIFIDADKTGYSDYLKWSLQISRPGTLIVADNVIRSGVVADPASEDENVRGVRRFLEAAAAEPRLKTAAIQTVGAKGYDGFSISVVVD